MVREVDAPSILIECGFLSNLREEGLLNDNLYQKQVAWAVYIGLIRYFNGEEIN